MAFEVYNHSKTKKINLDIMFPGAPFRNLRFEFRLMLHIWMHIAAKEPFLCLLNKGDPRL